MDFLNYGWHAIKKKINQWCDALRFKIDKNFYSVTSI